MEKNEKNIMGNTQDINLINKNLGEAQKDIEELKARLDALGSLSSKDDGNSLDLTELTISIKKELHNHNERIKDLEVKMLKLEEEEKEEPEKEEKPEEPMRKSSSGKDFENSLKELRKYIKEQLGGIDKKLTNLQSESNQHTADIERLNLLLSERDEEDEKSNNNENKGGE